MDTKTRKICDMLRHSDPELQCAAARVLGELRAKETRVGRALGPPNDNGRVPSGIEKENLSLWYSMDNKAYHEVPEFEFATLVGNGDEIIGLTGFNVRARYFKVHQDSASTDTNASFTVRDYNDLITVRLEEGP